MPLFIFYRPVSLPLDKCPHLMLLHLFFLLSCTSASKILQFDVYLVLTRYFYLELHMTGKKVKVDIELTEVRICRSTNKAQGRMQGGGGGGVRGVRTPPPPPPPPPNPPLAISRATCAFNLFITSDAYGYKAYFVF